MKYFDSNIYGRCYEPKSFVELIEILVLKDNINYEKDRSARLRRGQADAEWALHSSGARRLLNSGKDLSEFNMIFYEENLLEEAKHRGYGQYNGRKISDFELLARLQHHGCATRLIDFSRNAMIGIRFTCNSHSEKTGILLGIHCSHICGSEGSELFSGSSYRQAIKEINNIEKLTGDIYQLIKKNKVKTTSPRMYDPTLVSNRIPSQSSQFVFSKISKNGFGSLVLEGTDIICIAISPKLKSECIGILHKLFDCNYRNNFPDIDGFGVENGQFQDIYSSSRR